MGATFLFNPGLLGRDEVGCLAEGLSILRQCSAMGAAAFVGGLHTASAKQALEALRCDDGAISTVGGFRKSNRIRHAGFDRPIERAVASIH